MAKAKKLNRLGVINNTILTQLHPFRMRKIYKTQNEAYYVLTYKIKEILPTDRGNFLKEAINSLLLESEQLIINKKCLTIEGQDYRYSYQIEAYKHANQTVCFDENGVYTELIYRMGVEDAFRYFYQSCLKACEYRGYSYTWTHIHEKTAHIYSRMLEVVKQNPCNDLVAEFVKIIKEESKRRDIL